MSRNETTGSELPFFPAPRTVTRLAPLRDRAPLGTVVTSYDWRSARAEERAAKAKAAK